MKYTYLALSCLILSACGGSSDDNGGGNPTAPSSQLLISDTNARELGAAVAGAALDGGDPVDLELLNDLTTQAGGALSYADQQVPQKVRLALSVNEEVLCNISGSVSISANVSNEQQISVNDSASFSFDSCSHNSGEVVNGGISMTVTEVSDDIGASTDFNIGYRFTLDRLRVDISNEFAEVDGDIAMRISNSAEEGITTSVSSTSMTVNENGNISTLSNYDQSVNVNLSGGLASMTTNGSFSSPELGGSVTFTTTAPFTSGFSDDAPSSGTMIITGADNSSMTLTAVNSVDVTLEVDSDGDGNIDETINTSWGELEVFSDF